MDEVMAWHAGRSVHHSAYPAADLAGARRSTVSVCLPARDEAATIGRILERVLPLVEADVIDQVVVVDDSGDGTSDIARSLGAEVHSQSALLPEFGPVRGKGDAMWRALSVLSGEIVCFVDADSEDFGEHFVLGLIGPLLTDPDVHFVKGYYRRPLRLAGCRLPEGGGRVTELLARPLLNRFYPELAAILQPLAGEIAARRALLERLPFATGYAVDIGLLIDAWSAVGLAGLAQVDLDCRQNRHQPLVDLGPMAAEVLGAVAARLERDGRLASSADPGFLAPDTQGGFTARASRTIDRPPLGSLVRGVAPGPMFA